MRIPERLMLQVVCEDATDLSGLIVELKVTTGRKNPYRIYFPKTDRSGKATLTREDFVGQFTDQWESGLMDHSGTAESANSVVEVTLYDPSWSIQNPDLALAWPLLPHERTKWSSRDEQYRYRTSTSNTQFVASPIAVDIGQASEIVFPVRRKAVAAVAP